MKRRTFLKTIGAGLVLTATGPLRLCSAYRCENPPTIVRKPERNEYPSEVIDVHTHIFNAHYIPIVGALQSWGLPRRLAELLKPLFNVLAGGERHFEEGMVGINAGESFISCVKNTDEPYKLAEALNIIASKELSEHINKTWENVEALMPMDEKARRNRLSDEMLKDELYQGLQEIDGYAIGALRITSTHEEHVDQLMEILTSRAFAASKAEERLQRISRTIIGWFKHSLSWLVGQIREYGDISKFVWMMLLSERGIWRALFEEHPAEREIHLAVHHMMDMQKAYHDEKPYCNFKVQIERMRKVAGEANGKVVGFVAFDPRRDVDNGDAQNGLDLVEYALSTGNFCGVKLYPPMGYSATGNEDPKVDNKLNKLYEYCVKGDIPILTHCSAWGFEAYDGSGKLSNPDYWENVLERHQTLRLCYGHSGSAGGEKKCKDGRIVLYPGWCARREEWNSKLNFTKKVIAHCRTYQNVYCDISYLAEVLNSAECAKRFKANFRNAYMDDMDRNIDDSFKFADKVMFGSDWHMPTMIFRSDKFLDFMVGVFDYVFPDDRDMRRQCKEKFFHKNARHFLKLG